MISVIHLLFNLRYSLIHWSIHLFHVGTTTARHVERVDSSRVESGDVTCDELSGIRDITARPSLHNAPSRMC